MSPRRFDEPDAPFNPPSAERCTGPAREEHPQLADTPGHDRQVQRERSLAVLAIKARLREAFPGWSIIVRHEVAHFEWVTGKEDRQVLIM